MTGCQNSIRTLALVAVVTVAGCVAAPPPPLTELALARSAIFDADQAGAAQAAPAELNAARERLAEAEQLAPHDEQLARWRAKEAESDARLAAATARDAKARIAVAAADRYTP